MDIELSLLIKKHTDTLIKQTKSRPQETLEYRMNKQLETFSSSPLINLSEEEKRLSVVTSSEATNSVLDRTEENNSFSISIAGRCRIPNYLTEGIIDKLKNLLKLLSPNDNKLHVEEVRNKVDKKIKIK